MNAIKRKYLRKVFRRGSRLVRLAVMEATNPLATGAHGQNLELFLRSIHVFRYRLEGFPIKLKEVSQIKTWLEKQFEKDVSSAMYDYYRPVCRGRDGHLYSASDMDDAILTGI